MFITTAAAIKWPDIKTTYVQDEPALWLYIGEDQKLDLLKQFFPNEKIECFAIPKPGKVIFENVVAYAYFNSSLNINFQSCPLLTSYKNAIAHLDSCIQPMYFTYIVSFSRSLLVASPFFA